MSVNKVILLGHVGQDPTVKNFDNDGVVANLSLATTERGYTTKNGKVVDERTEWHNLSVWGGLAKVVEQYVKKGDQLYVEGKIRTRTYDKDGVKMYATDINVDNLQMLGKKGDREEQGTNTSAPETHKPKGAVESKQQPQPQVDDPDSLPF